MKNPKVLFGIVGFIVMMILVTSCGGDIGIVKNGSFFDDQGTTIGKILDGHEFLTNIEWSTQKDNQGHTFVIASGEFISKGKPEDVRLADYRTRTFLMDGLPNKTINEMLDAQQKYIHTFPEIAELVHQLEELPDDNYITELNNRFKEIVEEHGELKDHVGISRSWETADIRNEWYLFTGFSSLYDSSYSLNGGRIRPISEFARNWLNGTIEEPEWSSEHLADFASDVKKLYALHAEMVEIETEIDTIKTQRRPIELQIDNFNYNEPYYVPKNLEYQFIFQLTGDGSFSLVGGKAYYEFECKNNEIDREYLYAENTFEASSAMSILYSQWSPFFTWDYES